MNRMLENDPEEAAAQLAKNGTGAQDKVEAVTDKKTRTKAPATGSASDQDRPAPDVVGTDVLYVGIDLGTSRSAVASSNGVRDGMASVVGWPKDNISTKLHGSQTLFGEDALAKRLALRIQWPLSNGNLTFSELSGEEKENARRAAEELMTRLRKMAAPSLGQEVYAVIGAPAEATKENKQAIIEIAKAAGIDSVMVVSEPFAVAYAVDALEEAIVIDIGAGTIDLCRMSGSLPEPEDQITVFKGGNFVDEEIAKRVRESHPEAQFTIGMIKKAKERFSAVTDRSERAIVTFPVDGTPTEIDITDEVHAAVSLVIPDIVAAIKKLVSSFDPEFQERIRQNIHVSGGGSQIYGLRDAIEEGMQRIGGGSVSLVEEPVFSGANGALKLAQEMPVRYWETLKNA